MRIGCCTVFVVQSRVGSHPRLPAARNRRPAPYNAGVVEPGRIALLNDRGPAKGRYILYWMQQSQRAWYNPALEYAIAQGRELRLPVLVGFGLMDDYPEANARHYAFMLQGLAETARDLASRGIAFVIRRGQPNEVALALAEEAALAVCDRGYLLHQRRWRDDLADRARIRVVQVEGDVVVPIEEVSDSAQYAARTIRPRIQKQLKEYLRPFEHEQVAVDAGRLKLKSDIDLTRIDQVLQTLKLDHSVAPSLRFRGGTSEARRLLSEFIRTKLVRYARDRNEPADQVISQMSPYLHFGQISPLEIAIAVLASPAPKLAKEAYCEQLIVRRELACNYVFYTPGYATFAGLPAWCRKTLTKHAADPRPALYTRAQLEACQTHDRYWNAAMAEMVHTGFMHNYMRMYWGKRLLEWKATPEEAFDELLYLNNRHFLCGRDPNAYANVAWCFGLHDRPWTERPIFGQIRYMNAAGLERKFDMEAYVRQVSIMTGAEGR
jgi:deoxyribodipyrimidine photo-lyase